MQVYGRKIISALLDFRKAPLRSQIISILAEGVIFFSFFRLLKTVKSFYNINPLFYLSLRVLSFWHTVSHRAYFDNGVRIMREWDNFPLVSRCHAIHWTLFRRRSVAVTSTFRICHWYFAFAYRAYIIMCNVAPGRRDQLENTVIRIQSYRFSFISYQLNSINFSSNLKKDIHFFLFARRRKNFSEVFKNLGRSKSTNNWTLN